MSCHTHLSVYPPAVTTKLLLFLSLFGELWEVFFFYSLFLRQACVAFSIKQVCNSAEASHEFCKRMKKLRGELHSISFCQTKDPIKKNILFPEIIYNCIVTRQLLYYTDCNNGSQIFFRIVDNGSRSSFQLNALCSWSRAIFKFWRYLYWQGAIMFCFVFFTLSNKKNESLILHFKLNRLFS